MLGFTGTFEGTPISVQSSGMGCPSAAIVVEELVQLGVKRIVRVGTCGGLQADMAARRPRSLAISAVPSDGTMLTYTGGEPHAPTADFELVHAAVHQAKHDGHEAPRRPVRVLEHVLRPGRGPRAALVGPRRARRRDGGGDPLHDRGAAPIQAGAAC